jgi:hypothetical protein
MAASHNMKTWHVIVAEGYKTLFNKQCLTVEEANKLLKEKKEEYKGSEYRITKENY